jgi:hypothetical protein
LPRSQTSRYDDDDDDDSNNNNNHDNHRHNNGNGGETIHSSSDESRPVRATLGKKKKLIGPVRSRQNIAHLPPLAPSSAASRRDDSTLNKGPPIGTPRPSGLVAQWAITSPSPHPPAEKLTSIVSDNENDDDNNRPRTLQRTILPPSSAKNGIRREKKTNSDRIDIDDESNRTISSDVKQQTRARMMNDDESQTRTITEQRHRASSTQFHERTNSSDRDMSNKGSTSFTRQTNDAVRSSSQSSTRRSRFVDSSDD